MDIKRFYSIIDSFYSTIQKVDDKKTNIKLSEDKWSLREIVGHLIDSASNNHQRFVRLQFGDLLDFPAYEGEEWVKKQKYNEIEWNTLVTLWYSYNSLILKVIEHSDETVMGNLWVKNEDETIMMEELIIDYYRHLEGHISHFAERCGEL